MRNVKGALRYVERRKTARLATPLKAVSGKNLNVKHKTKAKAMATKATAETKKPQATK